VEIPLEPEYRFHSVFTCPVSKDQATEQNPPMVLQCGHVLVRESLTKLTKAQQCVVTLAVQATTVADCFGLMHHWRLQPRQVPVLSDGKLRQRRTGSAFLAECILCHVCTACPCCPCARLPMYNQLPIPYLRLPYALITNLRFRIPEPSIGRNCLSTVTAHQDSEPMPVSVLIVPAFPADR